MTVQEKNRAIEFEVVLYDDDNGFIESASPVVSIRRHSDDKYWDGDSWEVAYSTVAMTELTGDDGVKGTYVYVLAAQSIQDTYAARVLYTFTGDAEATPFEVQVMTTDQLELLDTPSNFMADVSLLSTAVAVAAVQTTVNAIPTTAMRGTDNAALAATAFNAATDGIFLTATGLDNIVITEVSGLATKWSEMLVQVWRAEYKKRILHKTDDNNGTMSYRNDADNANLLQAAYTEDATDQTMEVAA